MGFARGEVWVMGYALWCAFPPPPSRWTGLAMGYGFSRVWVMTGSTVLANGVPGC